MANKPLKRFTTDQHEKLLKTTACWHNVGSNIFYKSETETPFYISVIASAGTLSYFRFDRTYDASITLPWNRNSSFRGHRIEYHFKLNETNLEFFEQMSRMEYYHEIIGTAFDHTMTDGLISDDYSINSDNNMSARTKHKRVANKYLFVAGTYNLCQFSKRMDRFRNYVQRKLNGTCYKMLVDEKTQFPGTFTFKNANQIIEMYDETKICV
jgi:hypothetical protein